MYARTASLDKVSIGCPPPCPSQTRRSYFDVAGCAGVCSPAYVRFDGCQTAVSAVSSDQTRMQSGSCGMFVSIPPCLCCSSMPFAPGASGDLLHLCLPQVRDPVLRLVHPSCDARRVLLCPPVGGLPAGGAVICFCGLTIPWLFCASCRRITGAKRRPGRLC